MPVKVKSDKKLKVIEGGVEKELPLSKEVCYAITKKDGAPIVVAPVVTRNKRGVEVVRFRKVVDPGQCPSTHTLNRNVPKLKIGYRELPKALGLLASAKKAAPAKVMGKMLAGIGKKKSAAR